MRKWKTRAAKDDPGVWSDVVCMWPTRQGTYEVSDFYDGGTALTATGEGGTAGDGVMAWAFSALSGTRAYVVADKIWEYASGTLTDRTNSLTYGSAGDCMMCQYGNVTVMSRGTSASLAISTGGNFSALASSPQAKLVCVQSNALVAFNTNNNADEWVASDVGDYTNWATGEYATGRILDGTGAITAAIPFGNDIIVFKRDAIFRMTYVGGTVKWQIQKIVQGIGCQDTGRHACPAVSCGDVIFFLGGYADYTSQEAYYLFDGVSTPRNVCADLELNSAIRVYGVPTYDPIQRRVSVVDFNANDGGQAYFYSLETDAWGKSATGPAISTERPLPVRGDYWAVADHYDKSSTLRPMFYVSAADEITRHFPVAPGGATASPTAPASPYVISHFYGRTDRKTEWTRLYPLLRRKTDASTGTPSTTCAVNYYRELYATSADVIVSKTGVIDTTRYRFNFNGTDNFVQFAITFKDVDVEIDDIFVESRDAGAE